MSVTTANRNIGALLPAAQKACQLFLAECKKEGVDVFLTETYRSAERQKWLYASGRSRPGKIVTWTLNSNHMSRLAWDIAVSPPKDLYDVATLNKAGAIARRLGIEWGGNWTKTPDKPHFQVTKNWTAPSGSTSTATSSDWHVEFGDSGARVLELQKALNTLGYKVTEDSQFGPALKTAYIAWQKANGLTTDGMHGPAGQKKLAAALAAKKKEEAIPLGEQKNTAPSATLAPEVALAKEAGITDGTYLHRTATREEVAAMNYRVYKKLKEEIDQLKK